MLHATTDRHTYMQRTCFSIETPSELSAFTHFPMPSGSPIDTNGCILDTRTPSPSLSPPPTCSRPSTISTHTHTHTTPVTTWRYHHMLGQHLPAMAETGRRNRSCRGGTAFCCRCTAICWGLYCVGVPGPAVALLNRSVVCHTEESQPPSVRWTARLVVATSASPCPPQPTAAYPGPAPVWRRGVHSSPWPCRFGFHLGASACHVWSPIVHRVP